MESQAPTDEQLRALRRSLAVARDTGAPNVGVPTEVLVWLVERALDHETKKPA